MGRLMIEIKLETNRSLVSGPCLRIRTNRYDRYVWWHRHPRYFRYDRKDES